MSTSPDLKKRRKLTPLYLHVSLMLSCDQSLVARLQWTGAWNDVGALKRALLDSLTTERNQFAKGVMADIDK